MPRRSSYAFDLATARQGGGLGAEPVATMPVCPLCGRDIPPHAKSSRHHLTPKLKGGAKLGTVLLHQICHSAIHARFSEAHLARHLNEVEHLRDAPEMADFLAWVRTKPDDFHARTATKRDRRRTQERSGDR